MTTYQNTPYFSVIIPVYNRVDEIRDLLESLSHQTCKNFEVVIVEDGSTVTCRDVVAAYEGSMYLRYYYKENEGRSIARNYGMERAIGKYFVFFDSDCVIPENYFCVLSEKLQQTGLDCFGGPDNAHDSFTDKQKAISYSMTSFLTTGGIRGGKVSLEKFTPRTFNMGFSHDVYDKVGGFREMFSEDIDMSTRIRNAGFKIGLIHDAQVYHKRRVDFKKFFRQVHVFGMSRITLKLLYPGSLKIVHTLPALAVIIGLLLVVLTIFVSPWFILPVALYLILIALLATLQTNSLKIGLLAVPASVIQISGYGSGFIRAYMSKIIMRRGRDINQEIAMRKGK